MGTLNRKVQLQYLVLYFIAVMVAWAVTTVFIDLEKFWYFWDYKGYWEQWTQLVYLFQTDLSALFKTIGQSINESDYNVTPIIVPAILAACIDVFF